MYNTPSIPIIDFSSLMSYLHSYGSIVGSRRGDCQIDLFVFSRFYPFEQLAEVVVGRCYVDSAIMLCSHRNSLPVVDLTNVRSFHQGIASSGDLITGIERSNYYYNRPLMGVFNRSEIALFSSHIVTNVL